MRLFKMELSHVGESALLDFVLAVLRDTPEHRFQDFFNAGRSATSSELLALVARARKFDIKIDGETLCLLTKK